MFPLTMPAIDEGVTQLTNDIERQLQQLISPVRWRMRLRDSVSEMEIGALVGSVLCLLLCVMKANGLPVEHATLLAGSALPIFICALAGLVKDQSWNKAARVIDRHYELKDRTVTALEFAIRSAEAHRELQISDAIGHLHQISARDIVPILITRRVRWAGLLFAAACLILLTPDSKTADADEVQPMTVNAADVRESIQEEVLELDRLADETGMQPLKDLAERLREDLNRLDTPSSDAREMLKTISQMQNRMHEMAAELNVAQMDSQLADVAEALAGTESFKSASDALKKQALDKAADALESIDPTKMQRAEARPTGEKLAEAAAGAKKKGLSKMSETLDELSQSVTEREQSGIEQKSLELADQIRRHDIAKKMQNMLNSKIEVLAQNKKMAIDSNSEGNGASADATGLNQAKGKSDQKSDSASRKAGGKSAGNIDGEKTRLEGELQMARLNGQLGESGDSEFETIKSVENHQTATRQAQDAFAKYEKLSDAALESEPIPPGQRETIRKYFELIRPAAEDETAALK